MASPYATQGGSGGGSVYASPGATLGAAPPPKGRGFLGTLTHLPGAFVSDLGHTAINAPAGFVQASEAVAQDVRPLTFSPLPFLEHPSLHNLAHIVDTGGRGHTANLVKGYGEQTVQVAEHPLRHPGITALTLLPAAGSVARLGELGLGVDTTAPRIITAGKYSKQLERSRSALGRTAQTGYDATVKTLAGRKPEGRAAAFQQRRVGNALNTEARQVTRLASGPAKQLARLGRRLSPGQQKALQVVAEEAPLQGRLAASEARMRNATHVADQLAEKASLEPDAGKAAQLEHASETMHTEALRHQIETELLQQSAEHLTPGQTLADPKLQAVYDKMAKVAGGREQLLHELGVLNEDQIASRTTNAGRVALGASHQEQLLPATADLEVGAKVRVAGKKAEGRVAEVHSDGSVTVYYPRFSRSLRLPLSKLVTVEKPSIVGQEGFVASPNAVRIPDVATSKGGKALSRLGQIGTQGAIGHLQPPGSVTHEFTGVLREHGVGRQDTTQLVAESGLEAAKYAGLKHIFDYVRRGATSQPVRPDDIAIRLDNITKSERLPPDVRAFQADPEEFFRTATPADQAAMLDKVRNLHVFAGSDKGGGWQLDPRLADASKAEFQRLYDEGKIGWVPRRVLGDLGRPNAPLRTVVPGGAVRTVDLINNASRFAILYLKPAYAIPNILGNAALNLVQQGVYAPRNLAQAAKLVSRLHPDDYPLIDAGMGEGLARSISAHGQGRFSGAVDKAASWWSVVVDTPFRRASFIHEARKAGYRTPDQIHELLARDAHDPELVRIGIKANRDIIDYENLSPFEKEVVRRVVFFYPWVKGSTIYAGRFLKEHPFQAGAVAALGQSGQQFSQQGFGGPLPSFYEGLIPVGGSRAINPASVSPIGTPAQVANTLSSLLSGNIPSAASAANFFTPALSLAASEITRTDPATGIPYAPGKRGFGHIALDQLTAGLPQVALANSLRSAGQKPNKTYPPEVSGALGNFLLGGVFPRKVNKQRLRDLYASEQKRLKTGR